MRLWTILAVAALALGACGPKGTGGGTAGGTATGPAPLPAPTRVAADPPATSPDEEEMLSRAAAIRDGLGPQLRAKNCTSTASYAPCRNLSLPCALELPVDDSERAGGVLHRLVFLTGFETQSVQTGRWQAGGEYIRVEITSDGGWHTTGAAERNGGTCAGEAAPDATRRIRFSP